MVRTLSRVQELDAHGLTWSRARAAYKRDQVLLVRRAADTTIGWYTRLCGLYRKRSKLVRKEFTLENVGGRLKRLTAPQVFIGGKKRPGGTWYASFVIQDDADGLLAAFKVLPFSTPKFWKARHSDCLWFFVGQNFGRKPMQGRPEHTDAVMHSGTWHVQLSGTKTWYLRPHTSEDGWAGGGIPRLRGKAGPDGKVRLRVDCRAGDLLLVNTRLWWHQTTIDPTRQADSKLSLSCARDFYIGKKNTACDMTNVDGFYATKDVKKGSVIIWETEMPDCALPRSEAPNCVVTSVSSEGALVALRNLKKGDWLTVAPSDDESD